MRKQVALALGLLSGIASSFAVSLSGSIGFVSESPSGYINYHSGGTSDDVDVKNNLGFSSKTKPWVRLKLNTSGIPIVPNLEFDYLPMKFDGTASNQNFTYDGYTFNGTVSSTLKADHYDIFAYYHLPFVSTASRGVLNPKVGLGVRIVDFKADVSGTATKINGLALPSPQSQTVSKSYTVPVPMLYAALDVRPIPAIEGDFHIKGIAYGSNAYYDVVAEAKLYPVFIKNGLGNHLFIGTGYRYEELKIDASSIKTDFKVDGPFAEVGVVF
ncbi:MAG: TIGR04219 family outer membrane beta-barrel protein [Hydrogenobaculum sp.]